MDTFFNNLNQNLSTECLLLQILLNAGYPADTPAIGSSPNKEDELPMLRDFKASVKSLKRFFPEDTDIDSTEMGKLIFMLYHHRFLPLIRILDRYQQRHGSFTHGVSHGIGGNATQW